MPGERFLSPPQGKPTIANFPALKAFGEKLISKIAEAESTQNEWGGAPLSSDGVDEVSTGVNQDES